MKGASVFWRQPGIRLCAALSLVWVLLGASPAWAEDDYTALETQLFARTFDAEPEAARLNRLERFLTGQAQPGTLEGRKASLLSVWRQNALITPQSEAPPAQDLLPQPQGEAQAPVSAPVNQDATDYPAVSALEQKVFKQSYAQEDVARRLQRLEQAVFRQTYDELPMVDRVDQLALKVNPESSLGREESMSASPWGKGLPDSGREFTSSGPAIYSRITGLEEQVLGRSYGGELLSNRLNRLEQAMMGAPQGGSIDARLDRLITQYGRQTAQNRVPQVQPPQVYTPQQPMLGAGQGMNFSQEMLNSLPPALRQQMENQRAPGLSTQPRPVTPQFLPPTNPSQVSQSLQKSLVILEYQVFGRDYPAIPFSSRLDNLERQVFGRTYPTMPYNQRVSRLLMRSGGKPGSTASVGRPAPGMLMMMPEVLPSVTPGSPPKK